MTPPGKLTVAVLSAQPFDVSDYDITDVQRRSGDPCAPVFFFPFHIPVAHSSERKEGEIDRGGEGTIKYLARKRTRLLFFFSMNTKCVANWCFCLFFGFVGPKDVGRKLFLEKINKKRAAFNFLSYILLHRQRLN